MDAVVTDRDGRHVTDLRPEDFENYGGGQAQEVTSFSYVKRRAAPPRAPPQPPGRRTRREWRPAAAPRARPGAAPRGRTVALVVDDLSLPVENVHFVRRADEVVASSSSTAS